MDNKFYATKLEGLKIIHEHLVAIERVYRDLVALEDAAPGGDSRQEYLTLRVALDGVNNLVEDHVVAVEALQSANAIPKPTASQVHAVYVSSMK